MHSAFLDSFSARKLSPMKKLTVFAMTKKGKAVVTAIHSAYPGMIAAVVASRDSGMAEDCYEDIRDFCDRNRIPFYDRKSPHSINTDYSLAISWRWLIDVHSSRLIVFHDSLLPRYRGFNPLVTALINGDTKIGVTALFATGEYDRGDIIAQSATTIQYPITIAEAIDTIQANYVSLGLEIADKLYRDAPITASPQVEEEATYSLWRDDEDYFIDWSASAARIKRMIDAVGFPYKGAASFLDGKLARIFKAQVLCDVKIENRTPGKVIFIRDSKPIVVCGSGLLQIDEMTDEQGTSLLPLSKFRTRFRGLAEPRHRAG
jgi:methionyl-tRNA formyltransferase